MVANVQELNLPNLQKLQFGQMATIVATVDKGLTLNLASEKIRTDSRIREIQALMPFN